MLHKHVITCCYVNVIEHVMFMLCFTTFMFHNMLCYVIDMLTCYVCVMLLTC